MGFNGTVNIINFIYYKNKVSKPLELVLKITKLINKVKYLK